MLERIKKEIETRLKGNGYTNITMKRTGRVYQIGTIKKIWTEELMYTIDDVLLDDCQNVIGANLIGEYKTIEQVAQKIMELSKY